MRACDCSQMGALMCCPAVSEWATGLPGREWGSAGEAELNLLAHLADSFVGGGAIA